MVLINCTRNELNLTNKYWDMVPDMVLYKPVGKYQFAMACIRALVMSAYKVIYCLISQPKHVLGTQKNRLNEMVLLSTKL